MDKGTIRREMLKRRKELSPQERENLSLAIREKVKVRPEFREASQVAFYHPFSGEVDILPLAWEALKVGKKVLFPRVEGEELVFCPVKNSRELRAGYMGISEPSTPPLPQEEIELFLVPGVAFDSEGYRLGMGGGFYDRVLSKKGRWQMALGVAYDFQLLKALPRDWWDKQVDLIVTERRMLTPTTIWHLKRRIR
ncbi:MAG: 5-formyltetrahydrofolate cyclo-ligase [Aquificota bacterium]|nr:MAG: 5-formyltetrahydrofolate cyclo-ligase [Aquificota bacterium]